MLSLDDAIARVEQELKELEIPSRPAGLYDPVRYILSNGGKRVRPALALLGANLFRDEVSCALGPAMGVEIFHNFTLLHDDLMDLSVVRRGKPTVHKKWNDNIAILSGDVMSFLASQKIAQVEASVLPSVLEIFNRTAIEVCEGQMMDMSFENRETVAVEEYLKMIELKTAVLIAASLAMGAASAGASEENTGHLYQFGLNLGIAFQLQDDLLDTYGDPAVFGKKIGNDILTNKKTFLMINALERAQGNDADLLKQLIRDGGADPASKIAAVTDIFNRCGIRRLTEETIARYFALSSESLKKLKVPANRKTALTEFSFWLMERNK
jgi:geranylgeranyl diphosphate synthase type II